MCPCAILSDLNQIGQDLGKCLEDLGKYIKDYRGPTHSFDLTWKDVMLFLSQTLSISEREAAVQEPRIFGVEQHFIH